MSFTRLLPLLWILCFPSIALGQNRSRPLAPPSSCPVTKPADHPFVPPAPYSAKPSAEQFWFGSDRIWTALPVTGTWRLGHYTPNDPSFRQKLQFWRQGYDPHADPRPNLTVTGKRLDSPAAPLQSDGKGNGSWTERDSFIMTGINFPTAGCWQVTGRYEDDELTFVVWVTP